MPKPSLLRVFRRAYRCVFPRLREPWLDEELVWLGSDRAFEAAYLGEVRSIGGGPREAAFLGARYREGMRWRSVLRRLLAGPCPPVGARYRVLDVGGGNGAVELALAADPGLVPVSVDRLWNASAGAVHRRAETPFRRVVAEAHRLPFRPAAFDAVLSLETVEHLERPKEAGREAVRVLRPGAPILLTTPPRLRYALRPDPHFGLRGLALLPAGWQRSRAARHGFTGPHHYVHRLYGSAAQVARLFPGSRLGRVLSRSRAPGRWFWDALVLTKAD